MDDEDAFNSGAIIQPPDASTEFLFEGMLKKKSPKLFGSWQERFVRVTRDCLYYYKKKDTSLAGFQGAVPVRCIDKVIFEQGGKGKSRLEIVLFEALKRSFTFQAHKNDDDLFQCYKILDDLHRKYLAEVAAQGKSEDQIKTLTTAQNPGFWKNKNKPIEPDKKAKKEKDDLVANLKRSGCYGYDLTPKQLMERYLAHKKPMYPGINQPPRVNMFENLSTLAQTLFGGYKMEIQEQNLDLGAVYILGDGNYGVTHKSFLLHATTTGTPYFGHALTSMDLLAKCGQNFPLFPLQLHCGATADAVYAIYHPPLRSQYDSLFSWLPKVEKFPEYMVAFIAVHILLTLQYLHHCGYQMIDSSTVAENVNTAQPIQFPTLSPETIFFDVEGQIRVCDLFLNPNPDLVSGVPEYSCPEALCHNQPTTTRSDFWRLGVLLYELATGLPPFKPDQMAIAAQLEQQQQQLLDPTAGPDLIESYRNDIRMQLEAYGMSPAVLEFPPFISNDLKELILALLHCDPTQRLCDLEQIKRHPFMVNQLHLIHALITKQCATGSLIVDEQEVNDVYNSIVNNPTIIDDPVINQAIDTQFWNIDSLIRTPRLGWVQEHIVTDLLKSEATPINLTFEPQPVSVQRLNVSLLKIRNLFVTPSDLITLDSTTGNTNVPSLSGYGTVSSEFKDQKDVLMNLHKEIFIGNKPFSLLTSNIIPRLTFSINVEGDIQKTNKPIQIIPGSQPGCEVGQIDHTSIFDLMLGYDLPDHAEVMIEVAINTSPNFNPNATPPPTTGTSSSTATPGSTTATTTGTSSSTTTSTAAGAATAISNLANAGSSLFATVTGKDKNNASNITQEVQLGLITFPIMEIRQSTNIQGWFVLYDFYGRSIGEVEVSFTWENEDIALDTNILAELTNGTTPFIQAFGKLAPVEPRKMWSFILDETTLRQHEALCLAEERDTRTFIAHANSTTTTQQAQQTQQGNNNNSNNPNSQNSSASNASLISSQSSLGSGGGPAPAANRGTIVLQPQSLVPLGSLQNSMSNSSSLFTPNFGPINGPTATSMHAKQSILLPTSPQMYGASPPTGSSSGLASPTLSHNGGGYQPRPSQSGLLVPSQSGYLSQSGTGNNTNNSSTSNNNNNNTASLGLVPNNQSFNQMILPPPAQSLQTTTLQQQQQQQQSFGDNNTNLNSTTIFSGSYQKGGNSGLLSQNIFANTTNLSSADDRGIFGNGSSGDAPPPIPPLPPPVPPLPVDFEDDLPPTTLAPAPPIPSSLPPSNNINNTTTNNNIQLQQQQPIKASTPQQPSILSQPPPTPQQQQQQQLLKPTVTATTTTTPATPSQIPTKPTTLPNRPLPTAPTTTSNTTNNTLPSTISSSSATSNNSNNNNNTSTATQQQQQQAPATPSAMPRGTIVSSSFANTASMFGATKQTTPTANNNNPPPTSPVAKSSTAAAAPTSAADKKEANEIPTNWRRAYASDGAVYYYNKVTKDTSWDMPACLVKK